MSEDDKEDWIIEAIEKIKASVEGNVCHVCDGHIENKIQVGRCVYAEPCNHRLYQGTIAKT